MQPTDLANLRRDYGPWQVPPCPICDSEQFVTDEGTNVALGVCDHCGTESSYTRDYAEDPRVLALCDRIDYLDDQVSILESTVGRTEDEWRRVQHELDEERKTFPSPGVWLVEDAPGCHRQSRIAKIGELPDPMPLAAIERHRSAIVRALLDYWQRRRRQGMPAPVDVANAIIREIAREVSRAPLD